MNGPDFRPQKSKQMMLPPKKPKYNYQVETKAFGNKYSAPPIEERPIFPSNLRMKEKSNSIFVQS